MSAEIPIGKGPRPPYIPQYGNADVLLICKEAGLDPLKYATKDYFINHGISALAELFSDGELMIHQHGSRVPINATPEIRHGEFYAQIAQSYIKAQNEPGSNLDNEFNKLARISGAFYAMSVSTGGVSSQGLGSVVQVKMNQQIPSINYLDFKLKLNPDMSIMDIGPGVAGRQFIDLQAALLKRLVRFRYMPISKGPFVNEFLVQYGKEIFKKDPRLPGYDEVIKAGLFIGREDGMISALEEILATPQPSGRHDILDLVICNGLATVNREEFVECLKLTPSLIKPGGHLLLGLPVEEVSPGSARFSDGFSVISDKFRVIHQVTKRSGSSILGRAAISTYAVLQKHS